MTTSASGTTPASETDRFTLVLADPNAPGSAPTAIDLGTFGTTPNWPLIQFGRGFTVNASTHTTTVGEDAMVVYLGAGKVYGIDLRAGASHAPVQMSSLADACSLGDDFGGPLQVSADGTDLWVQVATANSSGSCEGPGLGRAYVRTTMSSSTAPASLPGGVRVADLLDDGAGNALAFLMWDGGGLSLYSTDLKRTSSASGAAPVHMPVRIGTDDTSAHAAYYLVDGTLRRLTWSSTGANLEPPTHTFAGAAAAAGDTVGSSDATAFYFPDGNDVLAVSGASAPHLVASVTGTPVYEVLQAGSLLALQQSDPFDGSAPPSVSVVDKRGGVPATVSGSSPFLQLWGASTSHLFYADGLVMHAVDLATLADTRIDPGASTFSVAYARSYTADAWPIASVSYCVPTTASDTGCSNGQVREVDADTLATTTLGSIAHASVYPFASLNLYRAPYADLQPVSGIPQVASFGVVSTSGKVTTSTTDLYLYTPGSAGSLTRLTTALP